LTTRRLKLHDLSTDVREMDAEEMEFVDGEFDFIWSWGVIHHSADAERIIREVSRVLKRGGQFRLMVYNRRAVDSYLKIARGLLSAKPLRGMSVNDILSYYTDGYVARYYTSSELSQLINANGLKTVSTSVLGQTSEVLPLPGAGIVGRFKYALLPKLPRALIERFLRSAGSFLFAVAIKPETIE
jgi:ubiquinone/menaquinone biosynthesis C-methylase UbiE